jgi:integrase
MPLPGARVPTGHVFRADRARGPVWYAKYRLPDGRQVQKKIGSAWTERGRPPAGFFTKRTAEEWLRDVLDQARRGTLPGLVATGATFEQAAEEWLRYVEQERDCKPSTLRDYRSTMNAHLLPAFGGARVEDVTAEAIEHWRAGLEGTRGGRPLSNRTKNKLVTVLHGIFERARKVYGLPANPVASVERLRDRFDPMRFSFYTPEEVMALVRAAGSEQDGAIYLTAAFTGLRRGELVALRWREVDFARQTLRVAASYANGELTVPKSGKGRSVPLAPPVAEALARLGQRERWTAPDDLVFAGAGGTYLDASALRRRYVAAQKAAGLRPLRFHDLRHTFGTLAVEHVTSLVELQAWMGHADIKTTMRYTHFRSHPDAAQRLAQAFVVADPAAPAPAE